MLTVETDRGRWNAALLALPGPHLLQTWEWGAIKAQTGWAARRLLWRQNPDSRSTSRIGCCRGRSPTEPAREGRRPAAAASFLLRRLGRLPLAVAYVPKGPLLDWRDTALADQVLAGIEDQARRGRAIFVKIDPDVDPNSPDGQALVALLRKRGWQPSAEQIQFRNTALIDLAPDEEALLAGMKAKWRYNVRLAGRRGVQVRPGDLADLPLFYQLYAETGQRDGFLVRPFSYYELTWRTFMQPADEQAPVAHLLLAEVEGDAVAGLMIFVFGRTAWYIYGASSSRHRKLMPNHLLQWEAMRLARAQGCTTYDLWGAPDVLDETDAMWGVWRFKEGFGARFTPHIGAWDYPVSRSLYWSYTVLMPRILDLMRGRYQP